jgi:hypothetical protein
MIAHVQFLPSSAHCPWQDDISAIPVNVLPCDCAG